jgi:hypothetical protein
MNGIKVHNLIQQPDKNVDTKKINNYRLQIVHIIKLNFHNMFVTFSTNSNITKEQNNA